jgi:hypothetical protein
VSLTCVATWFDDAKESKMDSWSKGPKITITERQKLYGQHKATKNKLEIDDLVTYIVNFLT